MRCRQLNFTDAAAWAAPEPANVVGNLEQTDRDRFEKSAGFDHRVFAPLSLEMIFRFVKSDAGALFQMPHHLARKIDMSIQTGADGGPAECELAQNVDRFLRPFARIGDLLRITGKFLAEPYWRRVHQVGPADLNYLPKLLSFRLERAPQFFQRGSEPFF